MNEVLYFPKMGLEFNLSRVAFSIGTINIYWYGIIFVIGFILGIIYISLFCKKFKIDYDDILDILFYVVPAGIIGARIYYVIFNFNIYRNNLWDIFKIREGGIAIYGCIIAAFLVCIIVCKRKNIKLLHVTDLAVGGLILGQAIGRWGNFVNIEAFGINTDLPWGMTSVSIQRYLTNIAPNLIQKGIDIDPIDTVHPCFLYESIWCFFGFLIILCITIFCEYDIKDKEKLSNKFIVKPGQLTFTYFVWYGIGRFIIEGLRVDSLMIGSFKISKILSFLIVICAIILFIFNKNKSLFKNVGSWNL